jgi:hypothetical protein
VSPLDYPFTPVPDRVGLALQAREIDRHDYAILGYLYRRADRDRPNLQDGDGRRFFPARQSLEQVAEGVRWTLTLDALSKRIRRLRERGWLAYDPISGRGARYAFRLYPENRSDIVPPFPADDAPTSDEPERATPGDLARHRASLRSESPIVERSTVAPTSAACDPGFEGAAIPHERGGSGESRPEVVPSSPESQEEDLLGGESYEVVRAREGSWFEERVPSSARTHAGGPPPETTESSPEPRIVRGRG